MTDQNEEGCCRPQENITVQKSKQNDPDLEGKQGVLQPWLFLRVKYASVPHLKKDIQG